MKWNAMRSMAAKGVPGPEASISKLFWGTWHRDLGNLMIDVMGPDGLIGEEIPLESRIISCCDAWNAMRTDRSYRQALSYEAALAELLAASGTQLDPALVSALVGVLERDERQGVPARSTRVGSAPDPVDPVLAELDAAAAAG